MILIFFLIFFLNFILFFCRWINRSNDAPNWDIQSALKDAVNNGAEDWFQHICSNSECENATDEIKLQNLIKLIQLVRSDLQRAIEYYDKIFQE